LEGATGRRTCGRLPDALGLRWQCAADGGRSWVAILRDAQPATVAPTWRLKLAAGYAGRGSLPRLIASLFCAEHFLNEGRPCASGAGHSWRCQVARVAGPHGRSVRDAVDGRGQSLVFLGARQTSVNTLGPATMDDLLDLFGTGGGNRPAQVRAVRRAGYLDACAETPHLMPALSSVSVLLVHWL
jgi:hypothetical protein